MPKCRDCLHWGVCDEYLRAFWGYKARFRSPIVNASADSCIFYKDRSRFVELPCRPDDSLFVIVPDKNGNPSIEEYTVYAVIKKRDRTILETRIGRFIWGKEPCWLSYTEAEQALKEREAT